MKYPTNFLNALLLSFLILILLSCNPVQQKPEWMISDKAKWPQILLTNHIDFKGRAIVNGASAFLVQTPTEEIICSAKHLMGEAMGVEPPVPIDSFDYLLNEWLFYPRISTKSTDTFQVTKLLNPELNNFDIVLFQFEPKSKTIQSLVPELSPVKQGDELIIIGCQYSSYDCDQNFYHATAIDYDENNMLWLLALDKFSVPGFSGAPVINEYGKVVGSIYGGEEDEEGNLFIVVEPLFNVKEHLE